MEEEEEEAYWTDEDGQEFAVKNLTNEQAKEFIRTAMPRIGNYVKRRPQYVATMGEETIAAQEAKASVVLEEMLARMIEEEEVKTGLRQILISIQKGEDSTEEQLGAPLTEEEKEFWK